MKRSKMINMGVKHFGPCIDITDPCYDRDVWCRLDCVTVKEGDYICSYAESKGSITAIRIELPDEEKISEDSIGIIGVDAGLAGFFNYPKPDYGDDEWSEFCKKTFAESDASGVDVHLWEDGFFSSSGWGDGEYEVFAFKNAEDEIVGLTIIFI